MMFSQGGFSFFYYTTRKNNRRECTIRLSRDSLLRRTSHDVSGTSTALIQIIIGMVPIWRIIICSSTNRMHQFLFFGRIEE